MALYGGVELPGHPDPINSMRLTTLASPMIRRMQNVGICLDREWLGDMSITLQGKKAELRREINDYIPADRLDEFVSQSDDSLMLNVESAQKIGELLYKVLGVGLGRNLKRTKSGSRISTGKKQMESLKREHPVIPKILEYRECSKLDSTYCIGLPKLVQWDKYWGRWVLHTTLLTTRTDTDRLASKAPNLQNIPTRTKLGQMIRMAFIARPGKLLVSRDYAQIELRLMANAAQDRVMMEIFRVGGDIHIATACRAFNLDYEYYLGLSKNKDAGILSADDAALWKSFSIEKRAPCKNVNFGVAYGLGAIGLYDLMAVTYATAGLDLPEWITLEWCEEFIEIWFDIYPEMRIYFELLGYRARRYKISWGMFGGVRRIPEVKSCHDRVIAAGLRQAGNNPVQRDAAGVFKIGMARTEDLVLKPARESGIYAEALLPVHDELIMEIDEEFADVIGEAAGYQMSQALVDEGTGELRCRVPILVDGHTMPYDSKGYSRWQK